ncbi:hypothetical protein BRADI_1g31615v3 [Brachypodium distachyon]|uniref:Uncharacterized protein n=1 Tax=Brachypodium distachyon TaxID=15368 RepID=A0A2K2DM90_BRADI|nr:hypothetical protein BRADI_1g31615v3 [Brachypodium distachyon]
MAAGGICVDTRRRPGSARNGGCQSETCRHGDRNRWYRRRRSDSSVEAGWEQREIPVGADARRHAHAQPCRAARRSLRGRSRRLAQP